MYTTTHSDNNVISDDNSTSDSSIKKAIKQTLEVLKINPPKFYATYRKEIVKEFNIYEDAIAYLSIHPHVKVYVR